MSKAHKIRCSTAFAIGSFYYSFQADYRPLASFIPWPWAGKAEKAG